MERIEGRVAVITGGANGIGLGMARTFLKAGAKVVIADINAAELDRSVAELTPLGEVIGHQTDVADANSVEALAQAATARFGAVHILCNNAGVGGFQRFETTSLAMWEWTLGVDLWGVIHGCRSFLPILRAQDEDHILNTASMAGFMYSAYNHPYNVAKAGVVALTEGLAREFAIESPHVGIGVLCPSYVDTTIVDDERNAPATVPTRRDADPNLQFVRDRVRQSLAEKGKHPDEVGDLCLAAIRDKRLFVFTHPDWNRIITARAEHIVDGRPGPSDLGSG